MRNLLLVWSIAAVLAFTGCTSLKPGCFVEDQAVTISTSVVVKELECSGVDAVRLDLKAGIDKLGLCEEVKKTGPLCEAIANEVIKIAADKAIPVAWGCKATAAKEKLQSAVKLACDKLPVKN